MSRQYSFPSIYTSAWVQYKLFSYADLNYRFICSAMNGRQFWTLHKSSNYLQRIHCCACATGCSRSLHCIFNTSIFHFNCSVKFYLHILTYLNRNGSERMQKYKWDYCFHQNNSFFHAFCAHCNHFCSTLFCSDYPLRREKQKNNKEKKQNLHSLLL